MKNASGIQHDALHQPGYNKCNP